MHASSGTKRYVYAKMHLDRPALTCEICVSWKDHSIDFTLDGSFSAASWLHKSIASMQQLSLVIGDLPSKMLLDVMAGGR